MFHTPQWQTIAFLPPDLALFQKKKKKSKKKQGDMRDYTWYIVGEGFEVQKLSYFQLLYNLSVYTT